MPTSTEEWFNTLWGRLESASKRRGDPWRVPAMATVSPDGKPEVRHVVLRHAQRSSRILEVHSDWASKKYLSLMASNSAEFCFWNPRLRIQMRLSGSVTIHHLKDAQAQWATQSDRVRSTYKLNPPPGQEIPERYSYDTSADARFIRLLCSVHCLDALSLGKPRHQRMASRWIDGNWQSHWVVP